MREVHGLVRRLGRRWGLTPPPAIESPGPCTYVAETVPVNARRGVDGGLRLNLMLPSINPEHYFGGIHTAVEIYRALTSRFPSSRIIVLDSAPRAEALSLFPDHEEVSADIDSSAPRQIVAYSDRYGRSLPVGPGERWLATAWWTAFAAQSFAEWQSKEFAGSGRIGYLIQDFEPGFYPWSSQYACALATYRPDRDIAVFNTALLAKYFEDQSLGYVRQLVFEPSLNRAMRPALEALRDRPPARARRILVYARPSTRRNAFELLCEGLRAWGWSDPRAREWEVVALGELTADLDLGPMSIRALGKLPIKEYAELLSTSAIGLSLMISPHPSYPPLEMAAFGMGVVTNAYANKDLANSNPGIRSIIGVSPSSIAAALQAECAQWESRNMRSLDIAPPGAAFLAGDSFEAIPDALAQLLHNDN